MTRNEHWLSRSRTAVWHPCTQMKQHETTPLVPISRGSGSWLHDFDGHLYLDCATRDEMEMLASRTLESVACA